MYKSLVGERGRFQGVLDSVAQWNREHQGTVAGGTVFVAGAGAAAARVEAAPIALAIGGITLAVSSGVDYMNNVLGRHWPREEVRTQSAGSFHDSETTIMSVEEIRRAAEEGRLAHEALALTAGTEEGPPAA